MDPLRELGRTLSSSRLCRSSLAHFSSSAANALPPGTPPWRHRHRGEHTHHLLSDRDLLVLSIVLNLLLAFSRFRR